MKKAWNDVKSFVTVIMTVGLIVLLLVPNINPPKEILALYCTSYGAVITYFFTKKDDNAKNSENIEKSSNDSILPDE
mgnify:CR=1 FL=1